MGWLVDKLKNGRVTMAVKELRWDLDAAVDFRRAEILVSAQRVRVETLEASGVPRQMMISPHTFPREAVMTIVWQLEEIIIEGEQMFKRSLERARSIGMDGAAMGLEAKLQRRAHQVWIATLGGMAKHADDLKRVWELLRSSRSLIPSVIDQIEAYDIALAGLGESQNRYPRDQIIEMCEFAPALKGLR
jgi:hypothetical protein